MPFLLTFTSTRAISGDKIMLYSETKPLLVVDHQLSFEKLLLDISAHFINMPAESIDGAIEDAQRRICEYLDIDMSVLWQWSDKGPHFLTITHLHGPSHGPERPVDIDGSKVFPWLYNKLLSGETLAFSTSQLPEEAHIDIASRRHFGVESSVAVPLLTGRNPILGILVFDVLDSIRAWSDKEVDRFKLVADVFANALARKRFMQEEKETQAKLALAAESADAGLWELDYATGLYWATEQARRIFRYSPEDIINMESFEESVHPEDLEDVRKALADSFMSGEALNVEYRITPGNSDLRWICSRGRPYFGKDGNPSRMLGISVDISERKQMEEDCKKNLSEVERLKKQLEQENYYLREDLRLEMGFEDIIGQSKAFKNVLALARQVASAPATVLVLGETGTGKGIIAHAIHQMGDRSDQPFVSVNCAALPGNLIESELFGREKGAFTGSDARQMGRFEVANHGTIFLDEIGDMPIELQVKLLRVLQEGEFERLGSSKTIAVDVRVIAATSRNLLEDVKSQRFREDLFYRLNVFPITIPPLRQRREDIPLLAQYFVEKYCRKMGKEIDSIPKVSLENMMSHSWPGNVRELEHEVERSVIISSGNTLTISDQCFCMTTTASANTSMKDLQSVERDHIQEVLSQTNWKIEGPGGAASILNIHPSTLRFRLKKLDIKRPS